MDEIPPRRRRSAFAVIGVLFAVAAVCLGVAFVMPRSAPDWLPVAVGVLGFAAVCFVRYWNSARQTPISEAPTGVPPDRLFRVELMARGGWLRRLLEPQTDAHLAVTDDELRLCYRRPRNPLVPLASALVVIVVVADLPLLFGISVPRHVVIAGAMALALVYSWSSTRPHDLRFPWSRVHSVSVGETRFHIRVDDDDYPEGFLVRVPIRLRKPIASLFAGRTSFHDEEANLAKSIREAGTSTSHS